MSASSPTPGIATMTKLLVQATRADRRGDRLPRLGRRPRLPLPPTPRSKTGASSQHAYYSESARLLELRDTRERISGRELYRRCERISEIVIDVAERIVYAVVKES